VPFASPTLSLPHVDPHAVRDAHGGVPRRPLALSEWLMLDDVLLAPAERLGLFASCKASGR
jgi:hypothetical protein